MLWIFHLSVCVAAAAAWCAVCIYHSKYRTWHGGDWRVPSRLLMNEVAADGTTKKWILKCKRQRQRMSHTNTAQGTKKMVDRPGRRRHCLCQHIAIVQRKIASTFDEMEARWPLGQLQKMELAFRGSPSASAQKKSPMSSTYISIRICYFMNPWIITCTQSAATTTALVADATKFEDRQPSHRKKKKHVSRCGDKSTNHSRKTSNKTRCCVV